MVEPIPISGTTKLAALIGSPVAHSFSPALHNVAFREMGIDARYFAFNVKPEDLKVVIPGMQAMGFVGTNVTMPLKSAVIPFLDELTPVARLEQAVNVVEFRNGRIIGHNTDGYGFMENLRNHGCDLEGRTFTLMGVGGAGSAILTQAAMDGTRKINVFCRKNGRSWQKASELLPRLAQETDCNLSLHDLADADDLRACIAESDCLANATSVGMGKGNTDTLVPRDFMREGMYVADACYFPRMTQLLKDAQAQGAHIVGGLGMLLYQAAASEEIWFNRPAPVDVMRAEVFPD